MFNSSPITAWEGAGAFFNYAGSGGAVFWFFYCSYSLHHSCVGVFKSRKGCRGQVQIMNN